MSHLFVVLAYILCNGLTTMVITPVQSSLMPEVTVFASLIYLPHGVRVLATWAYGWKAIPALFAGGAISTLLFRSTEDLNLLEPALLEALLMGAFSAYLAFELVRLVGYDFYLGSTRKLRWKGMIIIGALSSVINSLGQTLVFRGLIGLDHLAEVLVTYAVGDLVGLVFCMLALMLIFRWSRALGGSRG